MREKGFIGYLLFEIFGLAIFLGYYLRSEHLSGDPGVGWHLRAGEWMVKYRMLPPTDPFLFTSIGRPWINGQWLADVSLWGMMTFGGWPLLDLFVAFVALLIMLSLLPQALRATKCSLLGSILSLGLCFQLIGIQFFVRPVLFSALFFAIEYVVLERWYTRLTADKDDDGYFTKRENNSALWVLPLLFALWCNLHQGFAMGLTLLGVTLVAVFVEERFRRKIEAGTAKKLAWCSVGCFLATFLNPYGALLHKQVGELVDSQYFMNLISEWLPPTLSDSYFAPYWLSFIVFAVLFAIRRGRVLALRDILLLLVFGYLSLQARRCIPFFGIVLTVPLARLLTWDHDSRSFLSDLFHTRSHLRSGVGHFALCLVFGSALYIVSLGALPGREAAAGGPVTDPLGQILSIVSTKVGTNTTQPVRIFDFPDFGGLITYMLWPRCLGSLDDRLELNGVNHYREYFQISDLASGWKETFERYSSDVVIVPPTAKLVEALAKDAQWKQIAANERAVAFIKEK